MNNFTYSNVDIEEIEKFNAIAAEWWDPQGSMKPLHQLNPLRLQYILDRAVLKNKRVIDVGCGGGILTETLAKAGAKVTGIDMADALLSVAKQHAEQEALIIDYQMSQVEDFAQKNLSTFDVVTCMELLEHVPEPASVIQACANLVKPGGKLFFSTINRNVKSFLVAIVGAEYLLNILPKGTHHYAQLIRPSEFRAWSAEAGLVLKDIIGISYHLLGDYFELSEDITVNYMMCLEKL